MADYLPVIYLVVACMVLAPVAGILLSQRSAGWVKIRWAALCLLAAPAVALAVPLTHGLAVGVGLASEQALTQHTAQLYAMIALALGALAPATVHVLYVYSHSAKPIPATAQARSTRSSH